MAGMSDHLCPHDKQCPPGLSVPDVLMFCPTCQRPLQWHYCHYCCPEHGRTYRRHAHIL
jgi:hypothetical protein